MSDIWRVTRQRKREVLEAHDTEAGERLRDAEAKLDALQQRNHVASGQFQLSSAVALRNQLHVALVEQHTVQTTSDAENVRLRAVGAESASLRAQIARASAAGMGAAGPTVGGLSRLQSEFLRLTQDLVVQRAPYDSYLRSLEQTAVESLVTDSSSFIQIVEPTHLGPDRKYNTPALGALATLLLIAIFTEWYMPATGMTFRRRAGADPDQHATVLE